MPSEVSVNSNLVPVTYNSFVSKFLKYHLIFRVAVVVLFTFHILAPNDNPYGFSPLREWGRNNSHWSVASSVFYEDSDSFAWTIFFSYLIFAACTSWSLIFSCLRLQKRIVLIEQFVINSGLIVSGSAYFIGIIYERQNINTYSNNSQITALAWTLASLIVLSGYTCLITTSVYYIKEKINTAVHDPENENPILVCFHIFVRKFWKYHAPLELLLIMFQTILIITPNDFAYGVNPFNYCLGNNSDWSIVTSVAGKNNDYFSMIVFFNYIGFVVCTIFGAVYVAFKILRIFVFEIQFIINILIISSGTALFVVFSHTRKLSLCNPDKSEISTFAWFLASTIFVYGICRLCVTSYFFIKYMLLNKFLNSIINSPVEYNNLTANTPSRLRSTAYITSTV